MMKIIRKMIVILVMVVLVGSFGEFTRAAAEEGGEASVCSVVSANAAVDLSISKGGSATVMGRVKGNIVETSKVDIELKLQKYNSSKKTWITVKTWSESKKSYTLTVSKPYSLSSKGKYRSRLVAKLSGKKSETITKYSSNVSY